MATSYQSDEPTREEIDRREGPLLLNFGANWCGFCQATAPEVDRLLERFPEVEYLAIEDGPGRPLGRSFRVKLWPTLVFLQRGEVLRLLVRPEPDEVLEAFEAVAGPR